MSNIDSYLPTHLNVVNSAVLQTDLINYIFFCYLEQYLRTCLQIALSSFKHAIQDL